MSIKVSMRIRFAKNSQKVLIDRRLSPDPSLDRKCLSNEDEGFHDGACFVLCGCLANRHNIIYRGNVIDIW